MNFGQGCVSDGPGAPNEQGGENTEASLFVKMNAITLTLATDPVNGRLNVRLTVHFTERLAMLSDHASG
ncbi:hypothetical protein EV193_10279 [Herbihabitans rhizosphaerae]|uniref:Uncharacterized protein n=1 Tax=Herbihabitans rhizosphaerae TaxID=1872711 RepID=A0A4V2EU26_9PSEU|nr:hypothetical protein [Herbihabitans rhizosphaerae]RZS43103.1 hypothetical protein EV193_10279 [Herbihabitans rhizosphaerae]